MPGDDRRNKPSRAKHVSDKQEAKSLPAQQTAGIARERRTHNRRSKEAAGPIEDPMDVALGSEDEAWDRRRSRRDRRVV